MNNQIAAFDLVAEQTDLAVVYVGDRIVPCNYVEMGLALGAL